MGDSQGSAKPPSDLGARPELPEMLRTAASTLHYVVNGVNVALEAADEIERLREALDGLLSSDPRSDERNSAIARAECVLRGSDG